MNDSIYLKKIGIIDSCNFSRLAIEKLCLSLSEEIRTYRFTTIKDMLNFLSRETIDVIFYDTLSSNDIYLDPDNDIRLIRQKSPRCRICIISQMLQFISIRAADHEIDKRIGIDDLSLFIKIACQKKILRYKRDYRIVFTDRIPLTKGEIALLRGYLSNMNTKSICQLMHCDIRKFYSYREKVFLKAKHNPKFFSVIGKLLT